MAKIPAFVIDYFLLGKTRRGAIERFTQDGGVVSDVWLAFANDREEPQRVLVAPSKNSSAVEVGYALHRAIAGYRSRLADPLKPGDPPLKVRERPMVSPLENFVAVTLYFDELIRLILPLTCWWHEKHLNALRRTAMYSGRKLDDRLERAIVSKLQEQENEVAVRSGIVGTDDQLAQRRVMEAAPLAALIGLFMIADDPDMTSLDGLAGIDPRSHDGEKAFHEWIQSNAEYIARAAREELSRPFDPSLLPGHDQGLTVQSAMYSSSSSASAGKSPEPPEMIQRVFRDRESTLADDEGNCTVKADAATRVFDISCRNVTWAIIDSGIAARHPAFIDHDAPVKPVLPGQLPEKPPSRVRQTLDFTRIDRIRNFDLISGDDGSVERNGIIEEIINALEILPGREPSPTFRADAKRNLEAIARQLEQRIPPDWNLIEPLIQLGNNDDGASLLSDHGTHVAGILGADWRSETPAPDGTKPVMLQGVCPDINLYDLRVIDRQSVRSTEFAVLAALEYVQFVNARAASNGPILHGVNISMSIPHDVRNYGCGATPICVACDRLVGAGVVVVAAAGNRGWNELELGFGN
ncbi:MAG: S8 family serine peptidase, partial [bacterium]|nr:S8 family serine peptidase [Candidatus Kapabacteria bacterium]